MNDRDRGLELKVGIFVAVGLTILAALVVQFGRLGEGFKTYYPLTAHFADASGLLKGSDVLLGGAKIGRVSGVPRLVASGQGVDVPLRIYDYVKIADGSHFTVGSSGLLGDKFVTVTPPPGQPRSYLAHGARVEGMRERGLDDLTREGGALIKDLRGTVAKIDSTFDRLNAQALSKENMDHLQQTFDNLSKTTAALSESSKKIDEVLGKADETMTSAKGAADKVQVAAADAGKTIQAAGKVMNAAVSGNGLLAMLLTNKELANDLRALISNLRQHGVLFYRDSTGRAVAPVQPTPAATPRRNR
jgi:phospholipid/cholesterol/gamma-HCH transport system substrate-binding protein